MTDPRDIRISDYNYELPDERIAKFPLSRRDRSKLLVYRDGHISDDTFDHLPDYLPAGHLMVFNNTRVIQARMHFHKETGARIEVFLLEPVAPSDYEQVFQASGSCSWLCMIGNLKKWKDGPLVSTIIVGGREVVVSALRRGQQGSGFLVDFKWEMAGCSSSVGDATLIPSFAELLEAIGELPIPPYLNRPTEESDMTTYQTVYSKIKGSVAAPTAGLHFTPEVLSDLDSRGIDREEVTLHVGAGTFKPVKSQLIAGHHMHTEYICVGRTLLEKLLAHKCSAIAVGTTSVRTLESLYYMGCKLLSNPNLEEDQLHVAQWEPYDADYNVPTDVAVRALLDFLERHKLPALHSSTQIIIAPGYSYRIVKMLVTNFHQPQSTLLLLVSAFLKGDWRAVYDYALSHDFRFLSYGDSSLLIPSSVPGRSSDF